jgi:hypothetical protein
MLTPTKKVHITDITIYQLFPELFPQFQLVQRNYILFHYGEVHRRRLKNDSLAFFCKNKQNFGKAAKIKLN